MTAHWIEVKDDSWKLRSEVVGFQGISGGHDGNNLGRYFMGLCDRVGICSPNESKVRVYFVYCLFTQSRLHQLQTITLDNASANATLCQTVQNLHEGRNTVWNAGKNQLMYVI